jgi:hypothetical protein
MARAAHLDCPGSLATKAKEPAIALLTDIMIFEGVEQRKGRSPEAFNHSLCRATGKSNETANSLGVSRLETQLVLKNRQGSNLSVSFSNGLK